MSQPAIIVTPSTPIASPLLHTDLEKPHFAYNVAPSAYLAPPPYRDTMDQRTAGQRIQRRIQLVASLLALLLSAMALASLVHPALYVKPSATAIEQHASGFLGSFRVGLGDHELRSLDEPFANSRLAASKLRKRSDKTWSMPRINTAPVAAERDAEDGTAVATDVAVPEANAAPVSAIPGNELPRVKSIRAVQAQLMREAKARMLKRQEFMRKMRIKTKA